MIFMTKSVLYQLIFAMKKKLFAQLQHAKFVQNNCFHFTHDYGLHEYMKCSLENVRNIFICYGYGTSMVLNCIKLKL